MTREVRQKASEILTVTIIVFPDSWLPLHFSIEFHIPSSPSNTSPRFLSLLETKPSDSASGPLCLLLAVSRRVNTGLPLSQSRCHPAETLSFTSAKRDMSYFLSVLFCFDFLSPVLSFLPLVVMLPVTFYLFPSSDYKYHEDGRRSCHASLALSAVSHRGRLSSTSWRND